MARPFKESLDYFPLDVDFLEDKKVKLIKSEFGAKGILVLISLLALVYKSNGYFYKWDNDDCYLMSDGVGCGCGPEFIQEVLQGCIRRSIFNDGVFNMFSVLTSSGIQKRYLNAASERKNITLIKEYLLVDLYDEKICSPGTLKKLTINSINQPINSVNPPIIIIKPPNNTESKEKESKENNKNKYSAFFEEVWKLYPNKKGKGQISDSTKTKLFKIGIETLTKCIERYKASKPSWQQYQNGSTFFNSGYVDYLDENFAEEGQHSPADHYRRTD